MQVTSIEQLKIMAECDIIEIPSFKPDMPFMVKVKRASLLNLIRKGVIPNSLLSAAEELFYGKKASKGVDLDQLTNVMFVMAETALIEPSVADLESVGLELTDEQLVALFNYTQQGLKGIATFPTEPKNNVDPIDGETVQAEAKSDN